MIQYILHYCYYHYQFNSWEEWRQLTQENWRFARCSSPSEPEIEQIFMNLLCWTTALVQVSFKMEDGLDVNMMTWTDFLSTQNGLITQWSCLGTDGESSDHRQEHHTRHGCVASAVGKGRRLLRDSDVLRMHCERNKLTHLDLYEWNEIKWNYDKWIKRFREKNPFNSRIISNSKNNKNIYIVYVYI